MKMMSQCSSAVFLMLLIISNSYAGNVAVGTCYTVCNVGAVACFAIGGAIFGVCKLLKRVSIL